VSADAFRKRTATVAAQSVAEKVKISRSFSLPSSHLPPSAKEADEAEQTEDQSHTDSNPQIAAEHGLPDLLNPASRIGRNRKFATVAVLRERLDAPLSGSIGDKDQPALSVGPADLKGNVFTFVVDLVRLESKIAGARVRETDNYRRCVAHDEFQVVPESGKTIQDTQQ
jgi:hypothetical protein